MYKYIYDMKRRGVLAIGEADNEELAEESLSEDEETPTEEVPQETEDNTSEEKTEPVSKVQTLDIITLVMSKFDKYMEDTKINWDNFIKNGKIMNTPNFVFVDDLYNLLNIL